jgi:hypothetical protein
MIALELESKISCAMVVRLAEKERLGLLPGSLGAIYYYNTINERFSRLVSRTVASPEWNC